jgi:hypothetical protein
MQQGDVIHYVFIKLIMRTFNTAMPTACNMLFNGNNHNNGKQDTDATEHHTSISSRDASFALSAGNEPI